jgi:UDP-glucose 4-epimerase
MISTNQNVFISGVSGFLGRYISRYFASFGFQVYGLDSSPPENSPISYLKGYFSVRLPDQTLGELLKEIQPLAFIHCAGRASVGLSVENPAADFYANTVLTFEILNSLKLHAPNSKFILLSSAAVYGNPIQLPIKESDPTFPISPYGYHKLLGEQLCTEFAKVYGLATASVRIFSAYGPGLRRQVLWDICYKALTETSISLLGTGQESRDFIHALDVAKALAILVNNAPLEGEAYNLAFGKEVNISQLAGLVVEYLEVKKDIEFNGIVPPGNPLHWQADISKISDLGFCPSVPLEKGIKTFASWCQAELIGY